MGATQGGAPAVLKVRLFPLVLLENLIDLGLDGLQVEGRRGLHRRKLDGRRRQLPHVLLHHHETPEFPGIEVVDVSATEIVQGFAADSRSPLEGILAEVDDGGHVGGGLSPGLP